MLYIQTEFYAEACNDKGPTGELVFVKSVEMVDYGGNVVGGPYFTAKQAEAAQRSHANPTHLRPCPGMAYRGAGITPEGGICCGLVDENADVRTLPVNVTDGAKAALDTIRTT